MVEILSKRAFADVLNNILDENNLLLLIVQSSANKRAL